MRAPNEPLTAYEISKLPKGTPYQVYHHGNPWAQFWDGPTRTEICWEQTDKKCCSHCNNLFLNDTGCEHCHFVKRLAKAKAVVDKCRAKKND